MVIYDKCPAREPGELKPEISCVEDGCLPKTGLGFLFKYQFRGVLEQGNKLLNTRRVSPGQYTDSHPSLIDSHPPSSSKASSLEDDSQGRLWTN